MIDNKKKEKIALCTINTVYRKNNTFPENSANNRNAPFHEGFTNAFVDKLSNHIPDIPYFVSLASWYHGLNTTLGQYFFENVAHILSDGCKKKQTSLKLTSQQKAIVGKIITDLKNGQKEPNLALEDEQIKDNINNPDVNATNFTMDVFFEQEQNFIAIELKSVRPNSGEMKGEKTKVLEAKAALSHQYPDKNIKYLLGFPFDPTNHDPTGYDKTKFLNYLVEGDKYFCKEEVLISDELWNYLSGETNTMRQILDIVNKIATPRFMDNLEFLNDINKRFSDKDKYNILLNDWCLYSELEIFQNDSEIFKQIKNEQKNQTKLKKYYEEKVLKIGGDSKIQYNKKRYEVLKELIN